jgi:hypothetical protein
MTVQIYVLILIALQNNSCVSEFSRLGLVHLSKDGVDVTFSRCEFENNDFAVPGVVSPSLSCFFCP